MKSPGCEISEAVGHRPTPPPAPRLPLEPLKALGGGLSMPMRRRDRASYCSEKMVIVELGPPGPPKGTLSGPKWLLHVWQCLCFLDVGGFFSDFVFWFDGRVRDPGAFGVARHEYHAGGCISLAKTFGIFGYSEMILRLGYFVTFGVAEFLKRLEAMPGFVLLVFATLCFLYPVPGGSQERVAGGGSMHQLILAMLLTSLPNNATPVLYLKKMGPSEWTVYKGGKFPFSLAVGNAAK